MDVLAPCLGGPSFFLGDSVPRRHGRYFLCLDTKKVTKEKSRLCAANAKNQMGI